MIIRTFNMPCTVATGSGKLLNAFACSSLLGALDGPMCNKGSLSRCRPAGVRRATAARRFARDLEVRGVSLNLRKRLSRKEAFFT